MTTLKIVSIWEIKENQGYSVVRGVAALAMRAVLWPVRVSRTRKVMHQLAAMNEHELRDIGLVRQDVESALALGLDEDPTRLLAARAHERAEARRENPLGNKPYY